MFEKQTLPELFEQKGGGSKINEAQKGHGELVVTGGNAPELLDFLEETLNKVTLFVHPPVTFALDFVGSAAWYVGYSSDGNQPVNKRLAVIAPVSVDNTAADRKGAEKRRCMAYICFVSGRQQ